MLDIEGESLASRGNQLYRTKLKNILEPEYIGMFAAIEPDSGDYFLAKGMSEAMENARVKHPDKLFFLVRIEFPTATKSLSPRRIRISESEKL